MDREQFSGADKVNHSLLAPLERRLAPWVLPRLPQELQTYHLTMLTLIWCAGIVVFSAAAATDRRWLWMVSLMVVLQWATDHFDGKLGKFRGTGLVKWGFYMDHLLDYFFICAILLGYGLLLPDASARDLLWLMAACGGFVAHTALVFSTTNTFRISALKVGPTELRLAVVLINALLVKYGTRQMAHLLPYVSAAAFVALGGLMYSTHRQLWRMDMAAKGHVA